jgi:glycine oxidase
VTVTLSHTSPDVVVIGGGLAGLTSAWRAAQRGASVLLLERGELAAQASRAAAGMLAPAAEADLGERALLALGLRAAERWPAFAAELEAATGHDVAYMRCGTLMVARDDDEAAALERELGFRAELGVEMTRLRPSEARRLEPALAPTLRLALHAHGDHVADPRLLAPALAEAARREGAVLRTGAEVASVTADAVTLADGETIDAGDVVVAAGPWAGALAGIPVRPLKGQILRLRDAEGPGLLTRVVRWGHGYLVPRGDGRYVLGATMEDRGFDVRVTAGAVYELLRDAAELVPGVHELELEETFAGLRPTTPDNTPILGRSERTGLVFAAGHHRNGVLLASITGELVADALTGAPPEDALTPDRFPLREAVAR